jgi:hypothetical protein
MEIFAEQHILQPGAHNYHYPELVLAIANSGGLRFTITE